MQSEIILRKYRQGDEKQIAHLFFNNFPDTLEPDEICKTWLWQFQNEFSQSSGVSVAELSGEIVAHYAVMWLPMCYMGREIRGAISTATVTDVKARGKGLFTKLALRVFKEVETDGCEVVFGFPNSQSIRGFIKHLNWFEVENFPLLIKPIDISPFLFKILKNKMLSGAAGAIINKFFTGLTRLTSGLGKIKEISVKPISKELPADVDRIWLSSFAVGKIAVARKQAYLKWRYQNKPFSNYAIFQALNEDGQTVGILATSIAEKKGFKIVYVMDMMAQNDDRRVYKKFLIHLDLLARSRGADAISMLCMPNNPNKRLFYRHGLIPVPKQMFPQDIHFCARANSQDMDKDVLSDPVNWFITWGDLDIV